MECIKNNGCKCGCKHNCVSGVIKKDSPGCPAVATLSIVTVQDTGAITLLKNCLVHVMDNNTTYYIDGFHRILETWAGPVEEDDYDYEENSLGLRSQTVYDFTNNRAIYYDAEGNYRLITLSEETS